MTPPMTTEFASDAMASLSAASCSADAWTNEIPNAEGYYWVRGDRAGVMGVVEVENWNGELQIFQAGVWRPLADKKYFAGMEWSAPIYPPNDGLEPSGVKPQQPTD